jgi:thiol-disulfide isomerase/thioredoxin
MVMKNKIVSAVLVGLVMLMAGCDYVDQPYTVPGPNGCTVSEPSFTPRTSPVRKVLVEDITGHRCGNCPRAAETIENLMNTYGEQIIALGLHSELSQDFTDVYSSDTLVNPSLKFSYDFRTVTATQIDEHFGVSTAGLPNGMVNRKNYGGSVVAGYTTWSTHVASELTLPQQMDIQLKNFWTPADSSICSFYFVEALADLNANYKICMFIMEDSIVNWQKDYAASPTDIPAYLHRHVLRGSVNGTWGTAVNSNTVIADGEQFIQGFSTKIDPSKWNIHHLYIVAFVYDATTFEVIQAEETKFLP